MSARFVWLELKKLVAIDTDISGAKKQLAAVLGAQTKLLSAQRELSNKADALISRERSLQKNIDTFSLSLKEIQDKATACRTKADNALNAREFSALQREQELLGAQQEQVEEELLGLWSERDELQREQESIQQQIEDEEDRIELLLAQHERQIAELKRTVQELETSWQGCAEAVPPQLAAEYLKLRANLTNPVVPVVADSCSACFTQLLRQDAQELDSVSIIRCSSCYRFLYRESAGESATQPTAPQRHRAPHQ